MPRQRPAALQTTERFWQRKVSLQKGLVLAGARVCRPTQKRRGEDWSSVGGGWGCHSRRALHVYGQTPFSHVSLTKRLCKPITRWFLGLPTRRLKNSSDSLWHLHFRSHTKQVFRKAHCENWSLMPWLTSINKTMPQARTQHSS